MSKVMNVTPAEFKDICEVWSGDTPDGDAVQHMVSYYGCERYESYRVVVRYDAPCIPMMSCGLERFEDDPATPKPERGGAGE